MSHNMPSKKKKKYRKKQGKNYSLNNRETLAELCIQHAFSSGDLDAYVRRAEARKEG